VVVPVSCPHSARCAGAPCARASTPSASASPWVNSRRSQFSSSIISAEFHAGSSNGQESTMPEGTSPQVTRAAGVMHASSVHACRKNACTTTQPPVRARSNRRWRRRIAVHRPRVNAVSNGRRQALARARGTRRSVTSSVAGEASAARSSRLVQTARSVMNRRRACQRCVASRRTGSNRKLSLIRACQ